MSSSAFTIKSKNISSFKKNNNSYTDYELSDPEDDDLLDNDIEDIDNIDFLCNFFDFSNIFILLISCSFLGLIIYFNISIINKQIKIKLSDVFAIFSVSMSSILIFFTILLLYLSWRRTSSGFRGLNRDDNCELRWLWIHWVINCILMVLLSAIIILSLIFYDYINDYVKKYYNLPLCLNNFKLYIIFFIVFIITTGSGIFANVFSFWNYRQNKSVSMSNTITYLLFLFSSLLAAFNAYAIFKLPFNVESHWPYIISLGVSLFTILLSFYNFLLVFFVSPWGRQLTPTVVISFLSMIVYLSIFVVFNNVINLLFVFLSSSDLASAFFKVNAILGSLIVLLLLISYFTTHAWIRSSECSLRPVGTINSKSALLQ